MILCRGTPAFSLPRTPLKRLRAQFQNPAGVVRFLILETEVRCVCVTINDVDGDGDGGGDDFGKVPKLFSFRVRDDTHHEPQEASECHDEARSTVASGL